jgi:hypothetical protein
MKLSLLIGGAAGYVLGTKAGRERYEQIVSYARRVGGSQTVQSTAGVLQGQFDSASQRAKQLLGNRFGGGSSNDQGPVVDPLASTTPSVDDTLGTTTGTVDEALGGTTGTIDETFGGTGTTGGSGTPY